jgi:putative ubiquitin-RnfH superfamily antitoxin RatB of RatAB toxin-antitoxin module
VAESITNASIVKKFQNVFISAARVGGLSNPVARTRSVQSGVFINLSTAMNVSPAVAHVG